MSGEASKVEGITVVNEPQLLISFTCYLMCTSFFYHTEIDDLSYVSGFLLLVFQYFFFNFSYLFFDLRRIFRTLLTLLIVLLFCLFFVATLIKKFVQCSVFNSVPVFVNTVVFSGENFSTNRFFLLSGALISSLIISCFLSTSQVTVIDRYWNFYGFSLFFWFPN